MAGQINAGSSRILKFPASGGGSAPRPKPSAAKDAEKTLPVIDAECWYHEAELTDAKRDH